jgi:lipopolysaccharide/colanic/teichoic acid biosynthesis glycosyltransferase
MVNPQLNPLTVRKTRFSNKVNETDFEVVTRDELSSNIIKIKKPDIESVIIRESGEAVLRYIQGHLDLRRINKVLLSASLYFDSSPVTYFSVKAAAANHNIRAILDFKLTNHTRFINKYFKAINSLLPDAGIFIGCFESNQQRNRRVYGEKINAYHKTSIFINFIIHRVLPKLALTKKLYFNLTGGKYRYLSTAEVLGRLVSCGFEIIEYKVIQNLTYFVVIKTRDPLHIKSPTYGPIIRLKRIGKDGKTFRIYKFRTMHPYSEYLQDFVLKLNGYSIKGKPANDFRLTPWGKLFRKYWIDELPQLINVLKGDMNFVGVRPLSQVRYNQMPVDLQQERIKEKPGCIPPYVSLNMPTDEGNIEAERIYIKERERSSFTKTKFLFLALYNILSRKIVSE